MKKITTPSAKAGSVPSVAGAPVEYRIKPGVEWINGKRVRGATTVTLSAVAAAYDLGLGRISPADKPVPAGWQQTKPAEGSGDGGN